MKKLTRTLFVLSDTITLFIGLIALAMAIYFPFFNDGSALSSQDILKITGLSIVVVIGSVLLLCRKAWGLLLLMLPTLFWLQDGQARFAMSYLLTVLLVMGTPYLLAMLESRKTT